MPNNYLLKKKIKSNIAFLLYHSKLLDYLLNRKSKNQCIVLMYHRVLPPPLRKECVSNPSITLCENTFENQMFYLKQRFNLISIRDFMFNIENKFHFSPRSVLITFDDGWKDNFQYAFPILSKYMIPAIIYLSTGYIGRDKIFWQERITTLLLHIDKIIMSYPDALHEMQNIFKDKDIAYIYDAKKEIRRGEISKLTQIIKTLRYKEIFSLIERLENFYIRYQHDNNIYESSESSFLTWSDVISMSETGIDFGSHGVNHYILTKDNIDLDFELKHSKNEIEKNIGRKISTISYPNGDYNHFLIKRMPSKGYRLGFTTEIGYNSSKSNPYILKRININEEACSTIPLFLCRLLGIW